MWPSLEKFYISWITPLLPFSQNFNSFLFSALAVGCAVFFMIPLVIIIWHLYKKKYPSSKLLARNTYFDPYSGSEVEGWSVHFRVPIFTYNELEEATNNFHVEKELGNGGFGTVYHGKVINSLNQFLDHLNYSINFLNKRFKKKEQDLDIVLRCYSLGSSLRILPCRFFHIEWKCIF